MITGWVLYAFAVSLLVSGAAWCLEGGLARARVPTRWLWCVALFASAAIPLASLLPSEPGAPSATSIGTVGASSSETSLTGAPERRTTATGVVLGLPLRAMRVAGGWVTGALGAGAEILPTNPRLERWAVGLWLWGSALLAGTLVVTLVLLGDRRRRWPVSQLRGRRVRVAPRMGPAVVGVFRPEIVLPAWAAQLPEEDLELVLAHEEEHVRARDPLLLAASLLPVLAFPWNPAIWWKLRRLKEAVEVDCDRRVLERGVMAGSYGRLLVQVGNRGMAEIVATPAMSGSHPLLLRRLEAMRRRPARARVPVAVMAGGVSLALVVLALEADTPSPRVREAVAVLAALEAEIREAIAPSPEIEILALADERDPGPAATPSEARAEAAPPSQPSNEVAADPAAEIATVAVATEPDETPVAPDEVALVVADVPTFPTFVPMTDPPPFRSDAGVVARASGADSRPASSIAPSREASGAPEPEASGPSESGSERGFTAYEVAPDVLNRAAIQRALTLEYPSMLRDAGIGGTVVIHFFIDDRGEVAETLVEESSGFPLLDEAALRVARRFEFSPALNRDERVAVWIQVPLTFQAQ